MSTKFTQTQHGNLKFRNSRSSFSFICSHLSARKKAHLCLLRGNDGWGGPLSILFYRLPMCGEATALANKPIKAGCTWAESDFALGSHFITNECRVGS